MGERQHGTNSCYQGGCRWPRCRAAAAAYRRKLREAHPPPDVSARDGDRVDTSPDRSWKQYGACSGKPPEWWYPDSDLPKYFDDRALALCAACPVKQQCLAWALEHEDHGIWAGTSVSDRRRIRKNAGIALDSPSLSPQAVAPLPRADDADDPFEEIA